MRNYKNHYKRNRYRNPSDRQFKKNGNNQSFQGNYSDINEFRRNKFGRTQNVLKLVEKYTLLAKEALSNGDKILSENYFQHADHFLRISEKENISKNNQKTLEDKGSSNLSEDNNTDIKLEVK